MLDTPICTACGTQFPESAVPPTSCPICTDDRQYVPASGQSWTTLKELRRAHRNSYRRYEPGILGVGTTPDFAIGQRALLVRTSAGNILWDCIALIDDATIDIVNGLGGIQVIAISHPHYYSTMVEWSRAFDGAPVYLHAADREYVMRPDPAITYWEGDVQELPGEATLHRLGGHFPGGTVLHHPRGAEGKGALLTGDVIQVSADNASVSFMYSYPNYIPLGAMEVQRIAELVGPLVYDRIYGAWWDRVIVRDGRAVLERSVERYQRSRARS